MQLPQRPRSESIHFLMWSRIAVPVGNRESQQSTVQCDVMRLCESVPRGFAMRLCHAVPMENGSRFFMTLRKWMATYFNSPPTKPMSSKKVTSIDINDLHESSYVIMQGLSTWYAWCSMMLPCPRNTMLVSRYGWKRPSDSSQHFRWHLCSNHLTKTHKHPHNQSWKMIV